jgi:hypothetical protein
MNGMNEWLAPQISEHWPVNMPVRFLSSDSWLIRPGEASALIPIDGIVHEWITSVEDTRTCDCSITGIDIVLEHFSSRMFVLFSRNEFSSS